MRLDWKKFDTVLLDMDGTLLDLHFDNFFWREHVPEVLAVKNGWSKEEAKDYLYPKFEETMGTLDWYCVDYWTEALGIDIMQHKSEVSHKIAYRPNARHFLNQCRQQCSDVRLVTNAHRKVLNLKIQHTNLDQYFTTMLCSHELDYPKEQALFWRRLQQQQSFDPKRTLFIDDSESVLEAADNYGIGHIYSIEKPDSKQERVTSSRFQMLGEFQV